MIYQIVQKNNLTSKVGFRNRIDFSNAVLKNQKRDKGEQVLYYKLNSYKHKGYFDKPNNIREHVTLVKLMKYIGNVNHTISVVGSQIFDSNYEKALVINRKSLDIVCALSVGE